MKLNTHLTVEDGVATIVLTGEAGPQTVPVLNRALGAVSGPAVRELVLDLAGLTHLSSAALRCIVYTHQRLGRGVRIVVIGTSEVAAEAIRLTGLADVIAAQEPATP